MIQQIAIQLDYQDEPFQESMGVVHEMLVDWCIKTCTNSLWGTFSKAEHGVNIFTITLNWKNPTLDLPKDPSRLQRHDPLQFPNLLPPTGRTHFHGRWVLTQQNKQPVWVDHPPCNVDQFFDLPPNLPMVDAHWRGCKLPGAVKPFFSASQVGELIA